jgi:hypothetical protein
MMWAKRNLDFDVEGAKIEIDFVAINGEQDSEFELELMKNCKHCIMSGGAFSLLAAFLNPNKDKIIIKPGNDDWEY